MLPSPGQMLLLQQQPVNYATTPVMQPLHYIVAEAPISNPQGMILCWGHTAGTLTLGGRRCGVVEGNQGVGTWLSSHSPEKVISRSFRRIRSEGGAKTCQGNTSVREQQGLRRDR
ncbi:hypothetical protein VZT92_022681 [Zoarces viviparus]